MKVSIAKITFKIGDREIELTADEARKMHKQLDELFGLQFTPAPITQPAPITIERERWPKPWELAPWCQPTTTTPEVTFTCEAMQATITC